MAQLGLQDEVGRLADSTSVFINGSAPVLHDFGQHPARHRLVGIEERGDIDFGWRILVLFVLFKKRLFVPSPPRQYSLAVGVGGNICSLSHCPGAAGNLSSGLIPSSA